jgi:drug/metabolite transporter (DMT)-like permease
MSWFYIALGAPFLWAITNHIDKLLLAKYFKRCGVSTLIVFSALAGVITLPFLFLINPHVLQVTPLHIGLLLVVSLCTAASFWLYFHALDGEEASIVVVFYQFIPVFGALLGFIFLKENLSIHSLIAMAIILAGSLIISIEIDEENRFRLRQRTIYLMTAASLFVAIEAVLFKYVAVQESVWTSLFWQYVGLGVFGVVTYMLVGSCRKEIAHIVRSNGKGMLGVNVVNELIFLLGNFLFSYAYLLAPVALVLLVNAYQPLMVFAIGILLTAFIPKLGTESIKLRHVVQKVLAMGIVIFGTWLLLA